MTRQYDEAIMGGIRHTLEAEVLAWPQVEKKEAYGCPGYAAGESLFALLVTAGVALTQLDPSQREALEREHPVRPFRAGDRLLQGWAVVPLTDSLEVRQYFPYIRQSYQNALEREADLSADDLE